MDINYFLEVLSEIKEDIRILSDNGFQLEDFYYNYTFDGGNLTFFDLTCYKYLPVKNDYVRNFYYNKNIKMMNTFLVGLIYFGAFKHGEKNEYTKIYKANGFLDKNGVNEYIGDYIIEKMNNSSNDIKLD